MATVPSRELRNDTRGVLALVDAGEPVTITVDGRPVATLQPIAGRSRWASREEFTATVLAHQADAALTSELRSLAPDLTDDLDAP